jgi:hypothetical protein
MMVEAEAAGSRFVRSSKSGHYESWFIRANHPKRPLALWCRYTIFAPRGRLDEATAELWSVWFDGEDRNGGGIVVAKEDVPLARSMFVARGLDVRVGDARLAFDRATGAAAHAGSRLAWDLRMVSSAAPILLMPERFYTAPLPRAKSLVLAPGAVFSGTFDVNGHAQSIDGWVGSLNHNWGSQHTDEYAWGQIAGFDGHPESFLECGSGRVVLSKALHLRTPWTTLAVLRHEGRTYALTTLREAVAAESRYGVGEWVFTTRGKGPRAGIELEVRISAPKSAFAGLTYRNPPGGAKICHNTKIASAEVKLRDGGRETALVADRRAAFEVLSNEADGVPIFV